MKEGLKNAWSFLKLPVQIVIGVTIAMFVDHFATKPAIGHLESLRSEHK
jgi:hypothetical protein